MDEPSKATNRILLGTGFGLILICGFAIIEERMAKFWSPLFPDWLVMFGDVKTA